MAVSACVWNAGGRGSRHVASTVDELDCVVPSFLSQMNRLPSVSCLRTSLSRLSPSHTRNSRSRMDENPNNLAGREHWLCLIGKLGCDVTSPSEGGKVGISLLGAR